MNSKISDRDLINLSELTYQNISNLKDKGILSKIFFDGSHIKQNLQSQFPELKQEFIKNLQTFPDYYIKTFQKYKLLDIKNDNDGFFASGYYGAAFYNADYKTIVIANRGTESSSILSKGTKDFWADSGFLTGKMKEQFLQGFEFYNHTIKNIKINSLIVENIYLTGHSLGGGIAALQFVYFYGRDPLLREMRTFEAPGIGLVVNDSRERMAFSDKNTSEYNISERIVRNGYENISFVKELMIEYGTNLDWVYNDLPHIGKTFNPLSIGGAYDQSNPLTLGFATDVIHTLNTYKIYALNSDGNINCGHINLNNFFKFTVPLLVSLKLNGEEIKKYFQLMYEKGFNSTGAIHSALVDRFTNSSYPYHELGMITGSDYDKRQQEFSDAMNTNSGAVDQLYKYNVLFSFLKNGGPDKAFFMDSASKFISENYPNLTEDSATKAKNRQHTISRILDFQSEYNFHNLKKVSFRELLAKTHGFVNKDNLPVYEYLLENRANFLDNSFSMKELILCKSYANEYKRFCLADNNLPGRIGKMGCILFFMNASLTNGVYDY